MIKKVKKHNIDYWQTKFIMEKIDEIVDELNETIDRLAQLEDFVETEINKLKKIVNNYKKDE